MSDQIVIRTMKDDIAEMNSLPVEVIPVAPQQKKVEAEAPVFSLPAKEKPLASTHEVRHPNKNKNIMIGVGYIFLFLVLVSGGVYGYLQWGNWQVQDAVVSQDVPLSQVIPREAMAVVEYNLGAEGNNSAIAQLWSERSAQDTTSAVSGNPTALLGVPDITSIVYMVLPAILEPFAIVKNTEGMKEYVAQQSDMQFIEKNGWYILHSDSLDQYVNALGNGAIPEDASLLASADQQHYLIRYAMSPSFVSQQLRSLTTLPAGSSVQRELIFYILAPESDGSIRASAHIADSPTAGGVDVATSELISLIPSDATFTRVGMNFSEDVRSLESDTSLLDATVLAQPAVRQFITQLTAPYALFERKGSDGIRDIGLIVTLPSSLQQKIKTGEPIVEQALPALVPMIVGKALGIQLAFSDGSYNAIPLRYVNINGQTQALDYTIGDNFILISSSREGITALIDTSLTQKQGISLEGPLFSGRTLLVGLLQDPVLHKLLPIMPKGDQVPVIISSQKTSTGVDIQAILSAQ